VKEALKLVSDITEELQCFVVVGVVVVVAGVVEVVLVEGGISDPVTPVQECNELIG
jgi:hypothetical protein